MKRYIGTLRVIFDAEDDVEAQIAAGSMQEQIAEILDEDDTVDVTQVIPFELTAPVEPSEMANQMRVVADMLVATKIMQCFDLARELHKTAWILEHRSEENFDAGGYDYGEFLERATRVLERLKKKGAT